MVRLMINQIVATLLMTNQYRGIVYFQPNANHHTFWSNLNIDQVENDFAKLEKIGFNSIVLKPNWGDFISEIHFWNDPIKTKHILNKTSLHYLNKIIDIADNHNISVFLMPSIAVTPKLYTDAGNTLSDEIFTANYWVSFTETLPREPALYEHPRVQELWDYFHTLIAKDLARKTNIGGYIIEPETASAPRELTPEEIQNWVSAIRVADPDAIIGYTPRIHFTEDTCNVPNTDVVFIGGYPANMDDVLYADGELTRINLIRKFTDKPIVIRETGISTANLGVYNYDMTEKEQAIYAWSIDQLMQNESLGVIGYHLWCSSDFTEGSFGPPSDWVDTQSKFGLFRVDGAEKPIVPLLRNIFGE